MFPFFGIDNRTVGERTIWPAPKVSYGGLLDVKFVEGSASSIDEPITLQQAKDWAKVDVSDDDDLIEELITATREYCEGYLNQSLIPRTVIAIIDNSNGNEYLPYCPFVELVSITDVEGDTISSDRYRLQMEDFKRIEYPCLKYIRIEYTAGYDTVPGKYKTGLKQQFLWLYQHRGDEIKSVGMSPEAEVSLLPYRRVP